MPWARCDRPGVNVIPAKNTFQSIKRLQFVIRIKPCIPEIFTAILKLFHRKDICCGWKGEIKVEDAFNPITPGGEGGL